MSNLNIDISPFELVNFSCKKGDAFEKTLEVLNENETPFDFTDYTAKMQVRLKESTEVIEVFSTEDDSITLSEGELILVKELITGASGKYNYDLQLTKDGKNRTLMNGYFTIFPDYTT